MKAYIEPIDQQHFALTVNGVRVKRLTAEQVPAVLKELQQQGHQVTHFRQKRVVNTRFAEDAFPLPTDPDGVVRNTHFLNCHFDFGCASTRFEKCLFSHCTGDENL